MASPYFPFITFSGIRMIRLLVLTALASLLCFCSANTGQFSGGDYRPEGILAATLPEIADALQNGDISAEALVEYYLARIQRVDDSGPTLQSVLTINPDVIAQARALDAKREAGEALGPLHGVPILLKDNIESLDNMPTTAGSLALQDNITERDSPLVAGLREAGALILGKTNLSQWANFRSSDSMSGWSALGGQVRNPHMLDRNPCGSSSGSGAAMAASLAAGTVGTETNGSVICPSNANGIVGFKPTVGLVPQQYIVPISSSQDTAGPMTKTVRGAAMMLNAMASGPMKTDYVSGLSDNALRGVRVGVLRYSVGNNGDIVNLFDLALQEMAAAGAVLVEIEEAPPRPDGFGRDSSAVLNYEFKATLNDYLASTPRSVATRSLSDVIAFNREQADVELALFGQDIFEESNELGDLSDSAYTSARDNVQAATRAGGIDMLLREYNVEVLVAPSGAIAPRVDPINGDVWPSFPGAGGMAAIAGYPHLTVPMGTVHSMPVGVSFMSGANQDAKVLSFGYAYESRTQLRAEPGYLPGAEALAEIAGAMNK
jgi:amidase